jgi:hypothetical protein
VTTWQGRGFEPWLGHPYLQQLKNLFLPSTHILPPTTNTTRLHSSIFYFLKLVQLRHTTIKPSCHSSFVSFDVTSCSRHGTVVNLPTLPQNHTSPITWKLRPWWCARTRKVGLISLEFRITGSINAEMAFDYHPKTFKLMFSSKDWQFLPARHGFSVSWHTEF